MRLIDAVRALPNERQPVPDPMVISAGGSRSTKVRIASHVSSVKAGTPLKRREDGDYEPASDDETVLVAASFGHGGAEVHAYRSVTLGIYKNPREYGLPGFYAGDRVRISDIDVHGRPTFERHLGGRWYALTEVTVSMDTATPSPKKRAVDPS